MLQLANTAVCVLVINLIMNVEHEGILERPAALGGHFRSSRTKEKYVEPSVHYTCIQRIRKPVRMNYD